MGTQLQCPECKKSRDIFNYELCEAAQLTCPVCNTKFAITATLKQTMPSTEQPPGPEMSVPGPEMPSTPVPPPSNAAGGPPAGGAMPPRPESFDVPRMFRRIVDGEMDVDKAVDLMLSEKDKKEKTEEWKGDLSSFNTKLQNLAGDISYDGDLGDLVKELKDGDALTLKGEEVKLDLGKAKHVLERDKFKKNIGNGNVPLQGNLMGNGDDDAIMDMVKSPEDSDAIEKAIETYFS